MYTNNDFDEVNYKFNFKTNHNSKQKEISDKGNFKSSLEYAINSINVIEPGIYDRLLETYKKENR